MPRPSKYEVQIRGELVASAAPLTVADLVERVECSQQMAYKVIKRLEDQDLVQQVGRSETGGILYQWAGPVSAAGAGTEAVEASVEDIARFSGQLSLDQLLRVSGLWRENGKLMVEVQDDHGSRFQFCTNE